MKTVLTKEDLIQSMERYMDSCQWNLNDDYDYGYDYNPTNYGLSAIADTFLENKAELISLFEKSPHYNGRYQIVLHDESYKREIDTGEIRSFFHYLDKLIEIPDFDYSFSSDWKGIFVQDCNSANALFAIIGEYPNGDLLGVGLTKTHCWWDLRYMQEKMQTGKFGYYVNPISPKEYFEKYKTNPDLAFVRQLNEKCPTMEDVGDFLEERFSREKAYDYCLPISDLLRKRQAIHTLRDCCFDTYDGIVEEDAAKKINSLYPELRAKKGQKLSRLVNKFCTKILKVEKGQGSEYEKIYAKFADAINPLSTPRWTVLSIHPTDFLSMSNGENWESCHSINPNGCFSSGTLSYMLDDVSMVFYTVTKDYNGNEFEMQPKINRNMFHYGEDKLIQGRVYPQDNDGINAIYEKIRPIVHRVIAEAENKPNLWRISKGMKACVKASRNIGTHYPDIKYFKNCNVSYYGSSDSGIEKNTTPIIIGHDPICPKCGCLHSTEDNILCTDCQDEICEAIRCVYCNRLVDEDYAVYDEDTGNTYCGFECAEEDGCYYCENVNEFHSEHIYYDDLEEAYFYSYYDEYIQTDNYLCFRNEENALAYGCVYDEEEDKWVY